MTEGQPESPQHLSVPKEQDTEAPNRLAVSAKDRKSIIVQASRESISWSGPLPDPGALAAYDQVVPGSAKDIVDMYKAECRHEQEMMLALVRESRSQSALNSLSVVLCFLATLAVAAYVFYLGHVAAGTVLCTTAAAIAGGAPLLDYLASRNRSSKQNED